MVRTAYPKIGTVRYRVEWCAKLAFDDAGDVDRDRCTEVSKTFATLDEAKAFAETTAWPVAKDTFGIVEVDMIEFVSYGDKKMPWAGSWQSVGSEWEWPKVFSGEWENE
jgi:hypothetical protein